MKEGARIRNILYTAEGREGTKVELVDFVKFVFSSHLVPPFHIFFTHFLDFMLPPFSRFPTENLLLNLV